MRKDQGEDAPAKWAKKRNARKASLEKFISKETDDAWSADNDKSSVAKQEIVVSPMNVDDFAKLGEYPQSPRSRTSRVTSSVSIASSSPSNVASHSNVENIPKDKPVVSLKKCTFEKHSYEELCFFFGSI